ncbi:hypothetical protein FRC01_006733 [Tulasnella sp. 417]|nr:hypothetical protein FRC01_006733 [Tulasnella sp. 417]
MASQELAEEWLSFSGAPDEKASAFIQSLNRRAFAQGKSKDDEWLAQYAAACFSDDALTWYYDLAEEVQNSWRKMCPALLKEFSNKPSRAAKAMYGTESDIMLAQAPGSNPSLVPIPAAAPAAPASPAFRPPPPARPPQPPRSRSATRIGYIELADASTGNRLGYINKQGDKTITQDVNDALLLELPLSAGPSTPVSLRMMNSAVNDPKTHYAGIMGMKNPLSWWMLVACAAGNREFDATPLVYQGPQRLYVGQYLPIDTLAKDFINSNPKPRSEDMLCAYKKGDTRSLHGFRKVDMYKGVHDPVRRLVVGDRAPTDDNLSRNKKA